MSLYFRERRRGEGLLFLLFGGKKER